MILHLPMLRIIIPSNVAAFFRIMIPIAMFDVLEGFEDTVKGLFQSVNLNFRNSDMKVESRGMFDQMRSLGYETSNSINNLGTIFFVIIFLLIRLYLYGLAYIVNMKTGKMETYLKWQKKTLFYSDFLLLMLECYMELLICGCLNLFDISAVETGLSGEISSFILGWLAIIFTLLIVPGFMIMILRKTSDEIKEKEFAAKHGMLWQGISTKSKPEMAYNLVFCLRRILFCAIAFSFEPEQPKVMPLEYTGIQIQCLFMLNIFVLIYFG
jgi:hypothetical protein